MAEQKRIKQLTQAEKRRIITEQLRIAGNLSNRNLAKIIGCSPSTVGAVRRELSDKNEQFGHSHTQNDWSRHPYFLANQEQLLSECGLSEKSLIALRGDGVLDKMQEIGSLSPRYCQRLLYKERKAANKNHAVTINERDIRIFQGDVRTHLPEIPDGSVQLCFVDIELSLDILETMYTYPHITDFMFVSGDSDLRHVVKRLQKNGKNLHLMGFKDFTSQFLIETVNEFVLLDDFPRMLRKVTQAEKEKKSLSLISNDYVETVVEQMHRLESKNTKDFIGLNYFRNRIIDQNQEFPTQISDALTDCIDYDLMKLYQVENPHDKKHPTRACKLNRENEAVKYILHGKNKV